MLGWLELTPLLVSIYIGVIELTHGAGSVAAAVEGGVSVLPASIISLNVNEYVQNEERNCCFSKHVGDCDNFRVAD